MEINVSSEIGKLKGVIVHTPGHEVSLVNPELKDELLFDDIIFEDDARKEHLGMIDLFKAGMEDGQVYEIVDLLCEVFAKEDARAYYIERLIKSFPEYNLISFEKEMLQLGARDLLDLITQGIHPAVPHIHLLPSPNLLFTRDLAAMVNDAFIISSAAKKARVRESLMIEALVKFHPLFEPVLENSFRVVGNQTIEGGDVLVESEEVVLIGMSERTSFSATMHAADKLLSGDKVKHILAVDIPKQRASMHLDTIFTFASENECVAFPPAIMESNNNVVALSSDGDKIMSESLPSLEYALNDYLGRDYTFIKCGGEDRTSQFREQWTDGANIFALAPGVIVGYERNTKTFNTLVEHGYKYLTQYEFIEEYENKDLDKDAKIAVSFEGNELCRGRGGARCMTMPISRL